MEAQFYEKSVDNVVRCLLCPHRCVIRRGKKGLCGVRRNDEGTLIAENYGRVTSAAMDPMEKKPLYHFCPGTHILSLGTVGCNLSCSFCQNYAISQDDSSTSPLSPEDAVAMAERENAAGIAYTYNEPSIWYEHVLDTAKLAREKGLRNVLVTNGFINQEPLEKLLPYIDAANLDIKSIETDFYRRLCGGRVEPVLQTARRMVKSIHLEVTNLIIPGENDFPDTVEQLASWIAFELGEHVPVHLSAYFPRYQLDAPPTSMQELKEAAEIFSERSRYVYLGNVSSSSPTMCFSCGELLVERNGYSVGIKALSDDGKCSACGADNYFRR